MSHYDMLLAKKLSGGGGTSKLSQMVDRSITEITESDIKNIKSIGWGAFYHCYKLISITIPDSVTSIGHYAFYECIKLTNITIPNSVTSIGDHAFMGCGSLESVIIGSGVTRIHPYAFAAGPKFTNITIPSKVTTIGDYAFHACEKLTSIISLNTTPPTIYANTFKLIPADCAIFVPAASVDAYKAAQYWSDRAAYIQAIPE